jgi:hypothetical protein
LRRDLHREIVAFKHSCGDTPQRPVKRSSHARIQRVAGAVAQIELRLQRIQHLTERRVDSLDMDRIRLAVHSHLRMRGVAATGSQRRRGEREHNKVPQRCRSIAADLAV